MGHERAAVRAGAEWQLGALTRIVQGLRGSASMGQVLKRVADSLCAECEFDRAIVLSFEDDRFSARETDVLGVAASDRLRRQILKSRPPLTPGTEEFDVIRRSAGTPGRRHRPTRAGLADAIGLHHHAYAAIAPKGVTVALLVVDRSEEEITAVDRAAIEATAAMVGLELDRIAQQERLDQFAGDVRQFAVTTLAVAGEMKDAPSGLANPDLTSAAMLLTPRSAATGAAVTDAFSARESQVANLLVEGRSNKEMATILMLSPETIKTYVTRVLRKLGATNRAEAASRLVRLNEGLRRA